MHNWTGRTVWFLNQILFFNTLLKPIVTEWLYVLITLLCLWGWGKLEGWSGNVCRGQSQRRPIGGSCVADCVIYRWKIRRSQGIKERCAEECKPGTIFWITLELLYHSVQFLTLLGDYLTLWQRVGKGSHAFRSLKKGLNFISKRFF